MKKYLILLLVAGLFTFTACSDDDDANTSNFSIKGTWEITAVESFASIDADQCENRSTVNFKQDNTLDSTFYFEENDCAPENASGTWENLGNGNYVMELGSFGELEGEVNFSGADKFTFSTAMTFDGTSVPATFTLERQ
jgi:hypothetical protein